MDEVVLVYLVCQIKRTYLSGGITNGRKQDRARGQSLLAVDQMEGGVLARLWKTGNENEETHEVVGALLGALDLDEIVPEPSPLCQFPTVVSLEDRDHVLAWRIE